MPVRAVVALAGLLLVLSACRGAPSSEPPDPSASPQAKAEPAPIVTPTASPTVAPPAGSTSAGVILVPPRPLRADEPAPADTLPHDVVREAQGKEPPKELPPVIYSLTYVLRSSDVAPPPKGLDLSPVGVDAARKKSEPSLTVDLTPGHARASLHEGFVLPEGTDLRMRADRYGYVVVSPDAATYRVGPTGSLRAILGEGLFDAAPSSPAQIVPRGEGARLGRPTRHVEVTTRAAKASFELAHVPDAGDGGALVCRMFLDLMSTKPSAAVCGDGDVPLHVELRWSTEPQPVAGRRRVSGVSVFDAVSFARRTDLVTTAFLAPPPTATFVAAGEAVRGAHLFLARADLAAMRVVAEPPAHGVEAPGVLSLHNSTDELRYVWLDGIPLAWIAPGGRLDVTGVPATRATLQWRTFLGDAIDVAETVNLPATLDAVPAASDPRAVTSGDSPPP